MSHCVNDPGIWPDFLYSPVLSAQYTHCTRHKRISKGIGHQPTFCSFPLYPHKRFSLFTLSLSLSLSICQITPMDMNIFLPRYMMNISLYIYACIFFILFFVHFVYFLSHSTKRRENLIIALEIYCS